MRTRQEISKHISSVYNTVFVLIFRRPNYSSLAPDMFYNVLIDDEM